MSSRKKPRPSFDLPEEPQDAHQSSGWVYRTETETATAYEHRSEPPSMSTRAATSILENGSYAISYGIATVSQAMAFAMAIATLPLTIGARVIEEWASERGSTSPEPPA